VGCDLVIVSGEGALPDIVVGDVEESLLSGPYCSDFTLERYFTGTSSILLTKWVVPARSRQV
jgi:hypothetical protein